MASPLDTLTGQQGITNIESRVKDLDERYAVIGSSLAGLDPQILVCDWSGGV